LLLEGAPGIGKGNALLKYIADQFHISPSLYLKLSKVMTAEPEYALSASIAEAFALDNLIQNPGLYDHLTKILEIVKSNTGRPMMLVLDDLQILFDSEGPLEVFQDISKVFPWLLDSVQNGILQVILSTSSKSVLKVLKRCNGYDTILFKSLDAVSDELIIEYLLTQINDSISVSPLKDDCNISPKLSLSPLKDDCNVSPKLSLKFTPITAELFVQTFGGNLLELEKYSKSSLTVSGLLN
jgi:hypothetical protein